MRYEYDVDVDALYIYLREGEAASQAEVGDLVVDLDAIGNLLGVEVLSTRLGWDPSAVIEKFSVEAADAASLVGLSRASWPRRDGLLGSKPGHAAGTTALATMNS